MVEVIITNQLEYKGIKKMVQSTLEYRGRRNQNKSIGVHREKIDSTMNIGDSKKKCIGVQSKKRKITMDNDGPES
jgi:hypothetical protein